MTIEILQRRKHSSWRDRLNKNEIGFLTFTALIGALIFLSLTVPAKCETGERQAEFKQVTYTSHIRSGTPDVWTLTVRNLNCSENGEDTAQFFFRFYTDNELSLDEYNFTPYKTWSCGKNNEVSRQYSVNPWSPSKPVTHDIRIELCWYSNGTAHLEDTTSFTVAVAIHVFLQNIIATGYLAAYFIACFVLLAYNYAVGLEE
jgi:hypothetical protein